MKKLFLIFPIVLFFACSNNSPVDNVKSDENIEDTTQIETVDEPIYIPDSLDLYFEKPLDFYSLKKKTESMHSGGNIRLANKYLYDNNDSTYIYYDYWAIQLDPKIDGVPKQLCFKALKPWTTSEDRYYENDNEILVGIKTCMQWDGLQQSNFVNQPDSVIELRFGAPDTIVSDCYIYSRNDKILTLKIVGNKVDWFKYLWLNYSFKENPEIHREFVNW